MANTTKLDFARDVQGYNAYAPAFAVDNYSATIAAATAQSFTVPSNYSQWIAVFSFAPGVDFWVARNTTAAVPVGATFASTSSFLNPSARYVLAGDIISVISSDGGDVGVALYAVS